MVVRVEPLAVVVALSPYVQTRLNYADFSSNIEHVRAFKAGAFVGMKLCVSCVKVSTSKEEGNALAVSRVPFDQKDVSASSIATYRKGTRVFGLLDLKSRRGGSDKRSAQPYVLVVFAAKIGRVDD